ncbi:PREDICTED: ankyrin repeat family A protein 2-like [Cyphomyrmex costatus]|uniref:ankyrin repeat family A protein 2-like n=1 Tax=Cyphomyrmex costatus TaxID=456900 RepID=UPI0008521ECF|nr:PREDICTED: ankyrin repeat family A protein 2-like [Cyphomyrmex costatus]XP_018395215.1 PREDICTED: ankyrin repeat family A protein 2-like [Cyphomyrmex costatus]
MENQIHSELILKEEREEDETKVSRCSTGTAESEKSVTPDGSAIGIRPKPLIYKPENVSIGCKSEPLETKWHWAPGAWQDSTRTSAFQPYKPPTLLTNLQRGNTQTQIHQLYVGNDITFHTLAGQGELTSDHLHSNSVDMTDEQGLTGLMWACAYGQIGSVKQLLKRGASINHCGPNLQTSLHLAAAYGHHDIVKLLLNHGADPNACDEDGNTPLIYGAHCDHPHVCYELLIKGAEVTLTNVSNISAYKAAIINNSMNAKAVIENHLIPQIISMPMDEL